jgi:IS30 family transposase
MKQYEQLAQHERYLISAYLQLKWSLRAIARELGRSPSTISREIRRNSTTHDGSYRPSKAHRYARTRRSRCRRGVKFKAHEYKVVMHYLRRRWSPKQIAKTLSRRGELDMSYESIYQFIRRDRRAGGYLYWYCRILPKKGRKRRGSVELRGVQPGKRHISERPPEVALKQEAGHLEGDTVIGQDKHHCILTLVDRVTGYAYIRKLKSRTKAEVNKALRTVMCKEGQWIKTITFDNGTEFHDFKYIEERFPVKCYFATPYHSWERGANENLNGLIRQYLPKGMCMSTVTQAKCDWIAKQLNTRPRERFDFYTPEEMYDCP